MAPLIVDVTAGPVTLASIGREDSRTRSFLIGIASRPFPDTLVWIREPSIFMLRSNFLLPILTFCVFDSFRQLGDRQPTNVICAKKEKKTTSHGEKTIFFVFK